MSKSNDLKYAIVENNDHFLKLNRISCLGKIYNDLNDLKTREMFEENEGKYSSKNGITAAIINSQMYISPFKDVSEVLEAYGFEKGDFEVPFSHDIYEEFPNALGKYDIIRLVANHPKDPLNDIKRAYEYIYTHSEVFMKWNELLKRATKEKGEELDLAKFHITCHELMYEGPENKQRRDRMNEQLRDEARKYLYQNKELTKEMDNIESEEKQR